MGGVIKHKKHLETFQYLNIRALSIIFLPNIFLIAYSFDQKQTFLCPFDLNILFFFQTWKTEVVPHNWIQKNSFAKYYF